MVRSQLFLQKPPGSRLVFWSRDLSSALPPRVAPPIFRSQSKSSGYSQAPLLPPAFRGGAPVLVPWSLVRTVWLVDSTVSAPPATWDMYVCMVTHIARVWINRIRLPVLYVVSGTGKIDIFLSAFVSENLVSRDGFGSPGPRQPAHLHTQAESGAYLRDSSRVPRRRPFIFL